jgi:outer membrane cobalamin receptor
MEARMTRALRTLLFAVLFSIPTSVVAAPRTPVTGSVTDTTGAALVRAFVRLVDAAGTERAATITDDRGRFAVESCSGCRIEASLAGFRTATLTITAAQAADAHFVPQLTLDLAPIADAIVVTPTREAAPAGQSGASVTVFTADDIERRGHPSVADLLRETNGVAVVGTGGAGGTTSIFVRGGESSYTKVLLDGIPLNEPGGTFNFGNLSTANLARVEFVRGAQSALFGSDAMSGVLQLVTARGVARVHPAVTGSFEAGGYGSTRGNATLSGAHKGWDYSIGAERFDTDNRVANNAFSNTTLSLSGGGDLSPSVTLRVVGRVENGRAGAPGQTAFGRPDADAFFDRQDTTAGVTLEQRGSERWKQHVSYAYSRSNQESTNLNADSDYVPAFGASKAPFAFSDFTYDSHNVLQRHFLTYQADARFTGSVNNIVTAIVDWDGERARLDDRLASTSVLASRNNSGVSVQHQLFGRLGSVTTSVRYEHNDSFGNEWVPRVSAALVARASSGAVGNTTLKGNAGKGVKEPTILQSFSPNAFFLGNLDLLPERARTWDLGIEQRLASDRVRIEATYFGNRYQDQITTKTISFSPFTSQFVNKLGFTNAKGTELSVDIVPVDTLRLSGGYTVLRGTVFDRATAASEPAELATALIRRPKHSAFARAAWTGTRASIDLDGAYVGKRLDNDFSSLSPALTSSGGYWLWNAGARYRFNAHIDGFARVQNLGDVDYMEPLGYPAWRRTFHAGLSVRF